MSRPEYLVEIVLCEYKDEGLWSASGEVIREFTSKEEAIKFSKRLRKLILEIKE